MTLPTPTLEFFIQLPGKSCPKTSEKPGCQHFPGYFFFLLFNIIEIEPFFLFYKFKII